MKDDFYKKLNIIYIFSSIVFLLLTLYLVLDFVVIPREYEITATPRPRNFPVETEAQSTKQEAKSTKQEAQSEATPFSIPTATPTGEEQKSTEKQEEQSEATPTETPTPTPTETPTATPFQVISTDTEYQDENIHITITQYREYDTEIYVADILLSSPEYLKTAFAKNKYGRNITEYTSEIAKDNNAILAVDGDNYGCRDGGYVIRSGVLYREKSGANNGELFVIYEDGSCAIENESKISASKLLEKGAYDVFSFGPSLITDGEISISSSYEVKAHLASNPRTAIAWLGGYHYMLIVSDGRTEESAGLTLYELAEFVNKFDAICAYNLDGGGSTSMYFNGKVVNKPTSYGKTIEERGVSDIVGIFK